MTDSNRSAPDNRDSRDYRPIDEYPFEWQATAGKWYPVTAYKAAQLKRIHEPVRLREKVKLEDAERLSKELAAVKPAFADPGKEIIPNEPGHQSNPVE